MTSTLGYALLGLLARESLSGYDIATQLRNGVGPFWQARHSQIYPELARLEADGLVSHERVEQHDRPDKKVYSTTVAGLDALAGWVLSPLEPAQIRDELTLRAYSAWLVDTERAAAMFADQARQHREQLARYEEFRREMEQTCVPFIYQPDAPEFSTYATLRRGLAYERELAEWCTWLADALVAPPPPGTASPVASGSSPGLASPAAAPPPGTASAPGSDS
jgi:DNA-binding PadR family transcriptional regulator